MLRTQELRTPLNSAGRNSPTALPATAQNAALWTGASLETLGRGFFASCATAWATTIYTPEADTNWLAVSGTLAGGVCLLAGHQLLRAGIDYSALQTVPALPKTQLKAFLRRNAPTVAIDIVSLTLLFTLLTASIPAAVCLTTPNESTRIVPQDSSNTCTTSQALFAIAALLCTVSYMASQEILTFWNQNLATNLHLLHTDYPTSKQLACNRLKSPQTVVLSTFGSLCTCLTFILSSLYAFSTTLLPDDQYFLYVLGAGIVMTGLKGFLSAFSTQLNAKYLSGNLLPPSTKVAPIRLLLSMTAHAASIPLLVTGLWMLLQRYILPRQLIDESTESLNSGLYTGLGAGSTLLSILYLAYLEVDC